MIRKIIHIDEEKCNGCGLCATVRLLIWVIFSLKSSILFARTLTRLRMSFW